MLERIHSREQVYALFDEFAQEDNWYWWVDGAYPNFLRFEDWIRSAEHDHVGAFFHSYKTSNDQYIPLGFSKFYSTSLLHQFSYLTLWVLPSLRKQCGLVPYGFIAVAEAINFALHNFPLRKIYFHVIKNNFTSLGPIQRVAQIEGTLHEHYFLEGKYQDVVLLSITREQWYAFYNRYQRKIEQYF